jgi:hypothetical protein
MHATELLHKFFKNACPQIHKLRLNALLQVCSSIFDQANLSLSSLGRHLRGNIKVKNKIKKVDRLLGNTRLHGERLALYQEMAKLTINARHTLDIAIDWSPCPNNQNQLLRASLLLRDKAVELYSEVYDISQLGKYHTHKRFLERLKKILPAHCQVVIISDAGFRTEFFDLVLKKGWDFIGRIRTKMSYKTQKGWKDCQSLYPLATSVAKNIGSVLLTKRSELRCYLHLYKAQKKNTKTNPRFAKGTMPDFYRKSANDPWLLATSLSTKQSKKIIKKYSFRMKIEHDFRDTKDPQWGIGLSYTRCKNVKRLENLLLIGAISRFIVWLIGLAAEYKKLHYDFQANTEKRKRVLSLIFLGLQVIRHASEKINYTDILHVLAYRETQKCY